MNARGLDRWAVERLAWSLLLTAALLLPGWNHARGQDQPQPEKPIFIVVMKQGPDAKARAQELGHKHHALHLYRAVFPGFAAELNEAALAALSRNPNVEFIEKAHQVKAYDEAYPSGVDRIDADLAHPIAEGAGARVAIVDTGIDFTHEDLTGQVDTNLSATFISRGKATEGGLDDAGHGTHVAGTVAAILNNGKGVVGVAPASQLVSLKVLGKNGFGSSADIIAALDFITAHNTNVAASYNDMIHVANLSLGGSGSDTDSAYRRAYERAVESGCFIVVAAGNESDDAANHVPAAYDAVFTVSAMSPTSNAFASFSNFGSDVDITAPGVSILSTVLGGGYGSKSGTSMASPHVAGAAALYVGKHLTTLTADKAVSQIRAALLASGEAIAMPGDPDGIAEPLVDAQAVIGNITPPAPSIHVSVAPDKTSYPVSDSWAILTATVVDQLGTPVSGLGSSAFDLGSFSWSFGSETGTGSGVYTLHLDISGFTLGDTPVTVTVTDGIDPTLSASDTVNIRKAAPSTIYVSSIDHDKVFKNLRIYVGVESTDGSVVEGATVAVTVTNSRRGSRSFSTSTDAGGVASFRWANAPDGDYTVVIDDVIKDGTTYEASLNNLAGSVFTLP